MDQPYYFRPRLLAARATPLQQHNLRLHEFPPTASEFMRRKFGYSRGEAVKPYGTYTYEYL